MAKINGAEIIVRSLIEEKTRVVFGYPGGSVITLFDTIYSYNNKIDFYLPRHEQGGVHAADGYARATGEVGVCIVTSGPGATNTVTGLATAYIDSVPMVVFTGQVGTHMIGNDAFQEVDTTGITRPVTKHNFLVKDVNDLAQVIKDAFYLARTGRPGPILIDVPSDVQKAVTNFVYPSKTSIKSYNPVLKGSSSQLKKAWNTIKKAKKPIIYAGGGVIIANAAKEMKEFVDKTNIPITTTLLGLGAYPETEDLSLHMLGMHGTQYANIAITECDLIIAIGARFDDRVTGKVDEFAPHAKIIHIDIDPTSIGKSIQVDIPIVGDVKIILKDLNKIAEKCDIDDWVRYIKKIKDKYPLSYDWDQKQIKPQYVMEELDKKTKGKAIIVTDVGQHQMWAAQFYKYTKPRSYISSGGLGTMGYGLPAAMGVKIAKSKEDVVLITGDGSFQMNEQELATISLYKIGVKIIILNNTFLGMVRQWQDLFYDKRYSSTFLMGPQKTLLDFKPADIEKAKFIPDFVKLGEAFDIESFSISKPEEVPSALVRLLDTKEPILLDVRIAPEENVLPMVPAGSALNRMLS